MDQLLLRKQDRLEKIFYFMIAFGLIGPTLGIGTGDFRLTFFRIAFFVLAVGTFIHLVWNRKYINHKQNRELTTIYQVRWAGVFFCFWLLYAIISLTWAVSLKDGIRYLIYLGMMLALTFSFPFFIRTYESLWKTAKTLVAVYAMIIGYAVFESMTFIHLPASRGYNSEFVSVVTSVFTNQNDLATFITLALPFLITAIFMLPLHKKYKWVLYVGCIFSLYTLFATGSRSNVMLALPLACAVLLLGAFFVVKREKWTKKNVTKAIIAVIAAVILANAVGVVLLSDKARAANNAKLASIFGFLGDFQKGGWDAEGEGVIEGETGRSATVRKFLIINGFHFLHKSHYLGVGPGNIEPLMEGAPHVDKKNMHNWWLEVLVNFGVLIFVLYMAVYFWLLWRLWKFASLKHGAFTSPVIRWSAFATLSSLIGFFFGGMAPSSCIHYTPMWITVGIGLAVVAMGELERKKQVVAQGSE
ncbi:O-antigen ligase family protein [Baia soyae]|uniref:O-antigen ligase-like membrane protein n=1 Tax=Baia soyae TaxID=1544746 RepID=A0A4R2RPE0_9BACL|nr:O-antigen ligase family protein [Baia soyae]TCP65940.1 O-antigen ligase-like membrane protein [Baia soyae]